MKIVGNVTERHHCDPLSRPAGGLATRPLRSQQHDTTSRRAGPVSPALHDVRFAAQNVIAAALIWADRDFGESGELEAAAALADAVHNLEQAAQRAGVAPNLALDSLPG
jgi:hypothetical protein